MKTKASALPALTEEQFNALSPAEKRVAIARDVLAQLAAKRVIPKRNTWVGSARNEEDEFERRYSRGALVAEDAPVCYACGIGACFISAVRLGNRFNLVSAGGLGADHMSRVLSLFFSDEQFAAIEFVFEGGSGSTHRSDMEWYFDPSEVDAFALLVNRQDSPSKRIRIICESIIANSGEFIPPVVASPATESETT